MKVQFNGQRCLYNSKQPGINVSTFFDYWTLEDVCQFFVTLPKPNTDKKLLLNGFIYFSDECGEEWSGTVSVNVPVHTQQGVHSIAVAP